MIKREAKAQVKWGHYIQSTIDEGKPFYCNYDVKQTTTKTIPWSRFDKKTERQQIESLVNAEISGYHWKHSDMDVRIKPFDGSFNRPAPGYFVIWWDLYKKFTVIRLSVFLKEMIAQQTWNMKSLSYSTACKLAERIIKI